ncbi:MAG TPA: RNA polymerase factor sigma-54 [Bryobacteraceae bacterium]|jgi:RNA polymerase sigma-54 factor|nr:RNA polymerase factor sigma-54 [Bryobacteraceae bacterium]
MLSQGLHVRVGLKQTLTPGLVQMVTVLQMTKLELKEMIAQALEGNPVIEEVLDGSEEPTQEEIQQIQELIEAERNREPSDQSITEASLVEPSGDSAPEAAPELPGEDFEAAPASDSAVDVPVPEPAEKNEAEKDSFEEIDFNEFFNEYLDPGFKNPASEQIEKPAYDSFLSSPVTLADHLQSQLSVLVIPERVRDAADYIIGNLDENGRLTISIEEMVELSGHSAEELREALRVVQSLEPSGLAAGDVRECLMLQLESRNARGGVAWQILSEHMRLLENRQFKELAKALGRPPEHIQIAVNVIRQLNPWPGARFSGPDARQVEPDVYISKDGEEYLIQLNDDDVPQIRLNGDYTKMLDREKQPSREVRTFIKEKFAAALQLMKNIEQRKQTILKVCQSIVRRQLEFLEYGIDHLRPMMIKEIAEEIGVHPSTVSRAVAGKYAHTPQGVFELRYFFSEAVQGINGGATPLLILKRRVKKMIEEEDHAHPLTDEQITNRLRAEGIDVTRRTVAKYREDMRIPSTHQRRIRD